MLTEVHINLTGANLMLLSLKQVKRIYILKLIELFYSNIPEIRFIANLK